MTWKIRVTAAKLIQRSNIGSFLIPISSVSKLNSKIPLYILAGGRAERFGENKARFQIEGKALISRVAQALERECDQPTVVAQRAGEFEDIGLRTIADLNPGLGPMGGLQTALVDLDPREWLLLAACDWLGVQPEWVEALQRHAAAPNQCVYFDDGRPQPLLAMYHRSALPVVEKLLQDKRLAMQALIERLRGKALAPPAGWEAARNVNTREQLERE